MANFAEVHEASFRDPSGFIFQRDGVLLREIAPSYQEDYDLLMSTGLYADLTKERLLVSHEEVDLAQSLSGLAYKVIQPKLIPFVSYPYEWCFGQLKDAAKLTLEIQKQAITHGMVLKDASSYNVQFDHGQPVFIDTLSFERYDSTKPWAAYRQFCQHFLAPLALMANVDVSLGRLLALHLDGIPLDLASSVLPFKTKFSPTLGVHLHAHAKSQAKYAKAPDAAQRAKGGFSEKQMNVLIAGLEIAIDKLNWSGGDTEWADYYDHTHNYGNEGLDEKASAVDAFLDVVKPSTVWDLGANVGKFARLATARGAHTVAWDIDPSCVEWNYQQMKKSEARELLPLLQDLTNPSASLGWGNTERESLISRGPVDLIMALGLVHHLAISNNVPLPRIASFLASLCQYLIIEFIPKEDSQVKLLLATREDIFPCYTIDQFRRAFASEFELENEAVIKGTCRTLMLMKRRENP